MTKLFIVEDEYWTREMIKQYVIQADLGIEMVGEADNGADGCRIVQELVPEIVLTDMKMPLMDGIDLLRYMEENQPAAKVIILSGHDDFKYMHQAVRSGAVDYLLKPIDPAQLKHALQVCIERLDRSRPQPESLATLSSDLLNLLTQFKKNVYTQLNELAAEPVEGELKKCFQYLDLHFMCTPGQWKRVYHEFLIMQEQFIASEGLELKDILGETFLQEHAPRQFNGGGVLETLLVIYKETIRSLVRRKERKKIDLNQIFEYVQKHYADGISLESLALRFFVSKEYLSKIYKLQFGETLMEQIIRLRMEAAKSLILQGKLQIRHIAQRVGYEDISYFYKVFKKHYGMSPAVMRDAFQRS